MDAFLPSSIETPKSDRDDPRIGHLLGSAGRDPSDAALVFCGFPVDEGVRRNGGRPGAAEAPDAIRRFLYRLTPDARQADAFAGLLAGAVDLGDFRTSESLEQDQETFAAAIAPFIRKGTPVIILGGGHETAFTHFLAYALAEVDVEILNWDAHLDVRPLKNGEAHSGSPFRQAIEHPSGRLLRYAAAGLQPHSVATAHSDFVREHGGTVIWRDELDAQHIERTMGALANRTLVTFDLDAVDQAFAPGVSAPATGGIPVAWWLHAARLAGRSTHVTSMDVCELSPRLDVDDRTARLAALTVWNLIAGLVERAGAGENAG
jgi:formiminoglutamase